MTSTDRTAYTQGLRQLADILDANPDLPLPYHGSDEHCRLNWIEYDKASPAVFARVIPGTITKEARGESIDLNGYIAGLHVKFIASRDAVCERVVTGTHEVVVPATPACPATDATPETVKTVEDVTWVCGSILSGAS